MISPIQYQIAVANPVQSYLEGLKFGESVLDQRLNRQINQFNLDAARQEQVAQAQALRDAQEAQTAGQTALQTLIDNPQATTQDYLQAWVSNPAVREEIISLRDMLSSDQADAKVKRNTQFYAASKSGNVGVVRNLLKEELQAAQNSNDQDKILTTETALETLEQNPQAALSEIAAQTGIVLIGLKDPKFLESINQSLGLNEPEDTEAFQTLSARAEAGGLSPDTPEYQQFMLNNGKPQPEGFRAATAQEAAQFGAASGQFGPDGKFYPTESLQQNGFRQATPQEASAYGVTAGQFGPDGRFYPINPPSGFNLTTNPDGTFSLSQGPTNESSAADLNETQSKAVTYATRARGALNDFEPVADQLIKRGDALLEIVPLGLGREYQDPLYQQAQVAGTEFLQAILRKDTGAAITQEETLQYGSVYLPQPGDSKQVLETKKAARKRAIVALEAGLTADAMIALEAASGNAKNFATMTIEQLRALDVDALTDDEAEQALARLEELSG